MPIFYYDDIFLLEILEEGGFCVVQKAYHKRLGKYVAIKSFIEQDLEAIDQMKLEDELLLKVEEIRETGEEMHFLQYYGAFKNNKEKTHSLLLQMESGIATLNDILITGKQYECDELIYVLSDLIKGFSLLQKYGIANRDVKPENIILVENEVNQGEFFYKVSDFGIGCQLKESQNFISGDSIGGISRE